MCIRDRSIIGVVLIGLLINIGSIFGLIFPSTETKIAVYEDGSIGITDSELKNISTDSLVLQKVDQNEVNQIKNTLKEKGAEYKGIVIFKDEKSGVDFHICLLYTSDAADDLLCVDLGGRRIIKKKKNYIV